MATLLLLAACLKSAPKDTASVLDAGAMRDEVPNARAPHFLGGRAPTRHARVVSLAPSVTEIVFALGAGDSLVGVTRFCDEPAAARALPKIGGFLDPSLEAVAALKPDLIITVPNGQARSVTERLAEIGHPVLLLYDYTLADVEQGILAVARALDLEAAGVALIDTMRRDVAAVRARVAGSERPRVLFLYGHKPLVAAGPGSYADALIEIAGGVNAAGRGMARYPTLSLETLIGLKPEVIIDAFPAGMGAAPESTEMENLSSVPAVAHGRVYALRDNASLRPGPRVGADARLLAALLHPGPPP
ncbi:MAG: helical backbone metal receptor [Pseudomonadota bacterium]